MSSSGRSFPQSKPEISGEERPLIGVIGGSGLCTLPGFEPFNHTEVETPYGSPSLPVSIGMFGGRKIAFLPRHGQGHTLPPHKVPYKANLSALKSLGVRHVISTCVSGSLREEIKPGTFVVPDQFINLTWGRDDTSEVDRVLMHLPMAQPYCEHLRGVIIRELEAMGLEFTPRGTVVVIQGPRFSTIAESRMFAMWGADIVNMTQYPENYFAKELGLCYATVASITDYDVGIPSSISMQPDSMDKVLAIFRRNIAETVSLLSRIIRQGGQIASCDCAATRMTEYYKLAGL